MTYINFLKAVYVNEAEMVAPILITIMIFGYLVLKDYFLNENISIKRVTVPQTGNRINHDFAAQSWEDWEPNPPIYKERFDWEALIILAIEALVIAVTILGFMYL